MVALPRRWRDGLIEQVLVVVNPDKLAGLVPSAATRLSRPTLGSAP